jgi:hypothetical protein
MAAAGSILWVAALMTGLSVAADDSGAGVLKATPDRFDAATVPEGIKVEVAATIQNLGDTQVQITSVKTS